MDTGQFLKYLRGNIRYPGKPDTRQYFCYIEQITELHVIVVS